MTTKFPFTCPVCGAPTTYYADKDIAEAQCGRHDPPWRLREVKGVSVEMR